MKGAPRISDAEWVVMKVIWKKAPCLAADVIDDLAEKCAWEPATIKTLLNRLVGKRVLRFKKTGKSYLYSPLYTEEQCRGEEADSFLHRVFDGALSPMISHFIRSERLGAQELEALEKILKERKDAR